MALENPEQLKLLQRLTSKRRGHHEPGKMNKLEAEYAAHLDIMLIAKEIICWKFEAVKLRLADRTFYTPDFLLRRPLGDIEFHEVKGFWEDDARVKIKVAAEMFPFFGFVGVRKVAGAWEYEGF